MKGKKKMMNPMKHLDGASEKKSGKRMPEMKKGSKKK